MMQVIDIVLILMGSYAAIGVLFAIYFVLVGADRLDTGVKGSPWHFRLMIFPGSVLLWFILLVKLLRS